MNLRTILFACLAVLFCCLLGGVAPHITAQDEVADDTDNATSAEDTSHRRLPPYFSDLVTPGQRDRIYAIQDSYEVEIEALKKQLRDIVAKRDAEIEAVLEPEQRQLLVTVKEQSRLLREARAAAAARLKESLPADEDDEAEALGN